MGEARADARAALRPPARPPTATSCSGCSTRSRRSATTRSAAIIRQELGAEPEVVFATFEADRRSPRRRSARSTAPPCTTGDAGRGQGPAPAHPRDPPGRHRPHVRRDLAARLDAPVRRDAEPRRSSTSSPAGPPTRSTTSSRPARPSLLHEQRAGRPVRAHRPRLPRLHDVARPHDRADRGHPADRGHGRAGATATRPTSTARGAAATTSTGSCATSTGTCSTRCSCSATSTPTCTRPTSSCCPGDAHRLRGLRHRRPAPEPSPRVADALQLAPVPGRDRGRRPRAHALAGADDRRPTPRPPARQLIRVHQAFLYDAIRATARGVTAAAARPDRHEPARTRTRKLAVDILETDPRRTS